MNLLLSKRRLLSGPICEEILPSGTLSTSSSISFLSFFFIFSFLIFSLQKLNFSIPWGMKVVFLWVLQVCVLLTWWWIILLRSISFRFCFLLSREGVFSIIYTVLQAAFSTYRNLPPRTHSIEFFSKKYKFRHLERDCFFQWPFPLFPVICECDNM